jgi:hypothetical protein
VGTTDVEARLGRDKDLEGLAQQGLCLREIAAGLGDMAQDALCPADPVPKLDVPGYL